MTSKNLVKCYGVERLNERNERVETIYKCDADGSLWVSAERPVSNRLDVSSMTWSRCDRLPWAADYLGHYKA